MTYTDVRFNGIVTAARTALNRCVHMFLCVCVNIGTLSNTFAQSLKHDGTASEQRRTRALVTVCTAGQEFSILGEMESFSGCI